MLACYVHKTPCHCIHVGHECTFPGCASVIVIDGNLKNRRDICACNSAGWLTFDGLPDRIKTGCQLTPAWQSKYCYDHAPRVNSKTMYESEQYCPDEVVQVITGKKQTRNGTYYQVYQYFGIM